MHVPLKRADAQNTTSPVRCFMIQVLILPLPSSSIMFKLTSLKGINPKWESANLFCSVTISAATVNLVRGIDFLKVPEWRPLNAETQLLFLIKN